jgi:hypothetical protein
MDEKRQKEYLEERTKKRRESEGNMNRDKKIVTV